MFSLYSSTAYEYTAYELRPIYEVEMSYIYQSPPPISPAWELTDGWLLFYWGDKLEALAGGSERIAAELVSPAHHKMMKGGPQLSQWLRGERLNALSHGARFLQLHDRYQHGSFIVIERPELTKIPSLSLLAEQLIMGSERPSTKLELGCLHIYPTQHRVSSLCAAQLALTLSSSVQRCAPHPFWLEVLSSEIEMLLGFNKLSAPAQIASNPTQLSAALTKLARAPELIISRGHEGLELLDCDSGQGLIAKGELQRAAWEHWLQSRERSSALPLEILRVAQNPQAILELDTSVEAEPSRFDLPQVRDSLYMMNYEDAPSEYPQDEAQETISDESTFEVGLDVDQLKAKRPPVEAVKLDEPTELEDESSIFMDFSLSDVSIENVPTMSHDKLNGESISSPQGGAERSPAQEHAQSQTILSPSASFDLDVLNLSDSELKVEPATSASLSRVASLAQLDDTHNDGSQAVPDQSSPRASIILDESSSSSSHELGMKPTRVDLDRYMVEEALSQIEEESPTSTEAPPAMDFHAPQAKYMSTSDYNSPPSNVSSSLMSLGQDEGQFEASIHEEPTQISNKDSESKSAQEQALGHSEDNTRELNIKSVTSAEIQERKRTLSDVMRRYQSKKG